SRGRSNGSGGGSTRHSGGSRGGSGTSVSTHHQSRVSKVTATSAAAVAPAPPLTFEEKRTLSEAINQLDPSKLTRVVEIIQAHMPLGSPDEEIELDIDAMDTPTLRELQAFIMEVRSSSS
ncbi:unnamed protein product, partial [Discosporangium mesarthrocarpum]